MGAYVQGLVKQYPPLKLVLPFVRTPANLAQYGFDRSFAAPFQLFPAIADNIASKFGVETKSLKYLSGKLGRQLTHADPRVVAEAQGRVMTATLFAVGLSTLAYSSEGQMPLITGAGPSDKEERAALVAAGWQPYSFRGVDGRYYSYLRFDPFATLIGSIADFTEASQRSAMDPNIETFMGFYPQAVVAALANNITNKTYLQGLSNLIDIASGDERSVGAVAGGLAGSFIPGIIGNSVGQTDPYMREVRSVTDRLISRVPGMSDSLQPRRNVLGEKIKRNSTTGAPIADIFLPVRATTISDKVVEREMANLRYGFNPIPSSRGGVDLTDPAYIEGGQDALDRYSELSGTLKIGGLTLRQAVRKLIRDPRYQQFPEVATEDGEPSQRAALINKVIRRYRDAAWRELLNERPSVLQAYQDNKIRKAAAKRPTLFD